jgi:hypothetical protein
LTRQILRLRQTMEVLAGRLQAEGRTHAVKLLRDGLNIIDKRDEDAGGLTLNERMGHAGDELTGGQWMQSLERQQSVIKDLEALLEVLLDRQDLDKLEDKLEQIAQAKEVLDNLSRRQDEVQRESKGLQEKLLEGAVQSFLESAASLAADQRAALSKNETSGRSTSALERERIEKELTLLSTREREIAELLAGWNPKSEEGLTLALPELLAANDADKAAALLEDTAERLQRTASELAADKALEEVLVSLTEASEEIKRAKRQGSAQAGGAKEDAAKSAEKAVSDSQSDLRAERSAATSVGRSALEDALKQRAEALTAEAKELRESASEAMDAAQATLEAQADSGEGAQPTSAAAQAVLEKMSEGASQALEELRNQEETQDFLPEAIAGAQEELSEMASALAEALGRLAEASEQGGESTDALEKAKTAVARASSEMRRSAQATSASKGKSEQAATSDDPTDAADAAEADAAKAEASQAAQAALSALESALKAIDQARMDSLAGPAGQAAREQAASQQGMAEQAKALSKKIEQGEMGSELSEDSQAGAMEAIKDAVEAMDAAAKSLEEGRSGEASKEQRGAIDALEKAAREAQEGARPSTPQEQAAADALAEQQKAIENDLLNLAERLKEDERKEASLASSGAAEAAAEAAEAIESGDMTGAQQDEREVQREIEKAKDALEEEQEKYQQLRQEEALLQMTDELEALLASHQEQMAELLEVDAARAGRETPSRAQKLRLRRIAREQEASAEKAGELEAAILEEGSTVFSAVMSEVKGNLERIAVLLGPPGQKGAGDGYDSGERVQGLQSDTERLLTWLVTALREEKDRREEEDAKEEDAKEDGEDEGEQQEPENRLVPSQAELKLLRSMEIDVARSLEQTLDAWPELAEMAPEDVDPLILEDIMRLAMRHTRVTELFGEVAQKLGVPLGVPTEQD